MEQEAYKLRFWGVRGSYPTPGKAMHKYGGHTSCAALTLPGDERIVLDGGTGIRVFGESMANGGPPAPKHYQIFLSHYHLDHVMGIPFFAPLYDETSTITFHGFASGGKSVGQVLETLMSPPYFPVALSHVKARVEYADVDGTPRRFGEVTVESIPLNHPNGAFGYKLRRGARQIVYATDHEHGDPRTDAALVAFCRDADAIVYDATYVPSEYNDRRKGWGHSTWVEGVRLSRAAGARKLVLFHHDPEHTDEQLDAVLRLAREEMAEVEIAREGMDLAL
jgi:phosphoribosyl 1,2-cyclic phosphodiesterase